MSWEQKSLKEIGIIQTGGTPKTNVDEYYGDNYMFVTPSDLERYRNYFIYSTDRYISEFGKDNYMSKFIPPFSVMYTCIGNTTGKIALNKQECLTNQQINSIIPFEDYYYKYIYYYLINITPEIRKIGGGAATPIVNKKTFGDISIKVPPLQVQKRISDILSAYDNLIENNLKRINLLEQAAQNIYKEWFVNMRFPGYENTPINKETGLPEGWEVCTINDVCKKITSGGTPSRRNKSYWDNPKYPWVTTKELIDGFILGVKESVSEEGLKNSSAKLFPKGTVLMAIMASPTLGRLGILSKEACFNQAAVGFICDNTKITNQFLYYTLYAERANLNAIAIGAAQQNISAGKVKAHEIILPTFHFVKNFTSITSSNYEMRLNLVTQNQKLKAARDILLPRLMNQTIEV